MEHAEVVDADLVDESPHLKIFKPLDPPPDPETADASSRSPETFLDFLDQSNESAAMVEELTVQSLSSPGASSTAAAHPPRGLWPNLTRLRAARRELTTDDAWGLFLPQIGAPRPPPHKIVPPPNIVPPSSGFPQFSVKSKLKGKGVAQSQTTGKPGRRALFGVGGGDAGGGAGGISMREWLMQRQHRFNKAERLNFFRQVLELVEISHSQGLLLNNLRPSYFVVLPVNQIRYIGSLVPEGQVRPAAGSIDVDVQCLESGTSKRKMPMQPEGEAGFSKQRKLGFRLPGLKGGLCEETKGESYYPGNKYQMPAVELSKSEIRKLEERWYASPEELNDNMCYLSSNIYNLGVLVFELFCFFETWEAHCVAMSELRHRIFPPSFLSENSKETSLCLFLLHPDPSSRPKSRDILTCGLVCEGRDPLVLEQSSASIEEKDADADLLLHFLITSKEQKETQAAKLEADLAFVQADLEEAERRHSSRTNTLSSARELLTNSNGNPGICLHRGPIHETTVSKLSISSTSKDRVMRNIDQLKNAYFSMRPKIELSETNVATRSDKDVLKIRDRHFRVQSNPDSTKESTDRLGTFFDGLCKHARYSRFEVCGSLRNGDILNSTNVICSLSFDRDEEYFAAAGVSKKIKIFEFGSLLNDSVDIHYPLIEMSSSSMLSCVCWNNYIKNYLASTDYDGVVQLWDASTGQGFTNYRGHQKRAWSVDFSQADPMKLASGSDDCSVKLWSINEKNCINTIRNTANVCCVKYSSYSSHLLVCGSADYKIYCYDLRYTRIPWCTLSGHGKAVSYVKFMDSETLISASTDNTLKLWDLNKTNTDGLSTDACNMTFSGHTNEKNFVGLSVCDGYIACGSETNEVYAYYKTFPMPITSHKFGSVDPITGREMGDDNRQSVSSICWRTKSNMLVAATSSGSMKLLKLV